ncbi:hypothetical protein L210DRAFT_3610352 [Boletus edulis BED1]|uniref:Uncharacterized protein n=1 Tax=Boletus edulis BED1 TaxID=1328754 RepID=A0AAD4GI52_BOLED|nr:hypothetical protein L210DRAFT_3610352 [Boletus edulis BED1]
MPPVTAETADDVVATCKRRISELEQEINQIRNSHKQSNADSGSLLIAGRCIRRLVSLTDRVEDLVNEADRRACMDDPEAQYTEESDRLFSAHQRLLYWQPSLGKDVFKELNRGADSARGDDAASLKPIVIHWLMEAYPNAASGLEFGMKHGRGFNHDVTGRLLCPVDYNWNDATHRAAILDSHPDFLVTSDSWPAFLYEGETYDPKDPRKGLFKNLLLLKAFKHIFTSPSSALKTGAESEHTTLSKRQCKLDECRTRSDLRFALSSCGSWRIADGDFNYHCFYNNVVSFFECSETAEDKKFTQDLLFWWNRKVFGRANMSVYRPRNASKMSVSMSLSKGHGV